MPCKKRKKFSRHQNKNRWTSSMEMGRKLWKWFVKCHSEMMTRLGCLTWRTRDTLQENDFGNKETKSFSISAKLLWHFFENRFATSWRHTRSDHTSIRLLLSLPLPPGSFDETKGNACVRTSYKISQDLCFFSPFFGIACVGVCTFRNGFEINLSVLEPSFSFPTHHYQLGKQISRKCWEMRQWNYSFDWTPSAPLGR